VGFRRGTRDASFSRETRDASFAALTAQIVAAKGVAVGSYKTACLERRIASRMRSRDVASYDAYAKLLRDEPAEYDALLDALTINVTHLFRDTDVWEAVATRVLPELWATPHESLHSWVAGCASGEEAYTLASLWHQLIQQRGESRRTGRVRITATDIEPSALEVARAGKYSREAFRDTPIDVRARYFSPSEPSVAADDLRRMIRFEQRDLLKSAPPAGTVHLITCRNVLIYFDKPSQDAIFARFRASLVPGGYLVVGKAEALLGAARDMFVAVDHKVRLFRRP
jgi:chemotaxis methyl-accepting protein methylase